MTVLKTNEYGIYFKPMRFLTPDHMNLVVANENNRGEINQMIDSFDRKGEAFWQKRNAIKLVNYAIVENLPIPLQPEPQ